MARAKPEPEITGFFVGGIVPLEMVGHFLKAHYEKGTTGIKLDAFYEVREKAPKRLNGEAETKALPAPDGEAAAPRPPAEPKQERGEPLPYNEFMLRAMPIDREALTQRVKAAGYKTDQIGSRLLHMIKRGDVERKGSLIRMTPRFLKKRLTAPPPSALPEKKIRGRSPVRGKGGMPHLDSQEGFVLATAIKVWPDTIKTPVLRDIFTRKGWRPESISVATGSLKNRKLLDHVGAGEYRFNKNTDVIAALTLFTAEHANKET